MVAERVTAKYLQTILTTYLSVQFLVVFTMVFLWVYFTPQKYWEVDKIYLLMTKFDVKTLLVKEKYKAHF